MERKETRRTWCDGSGKVRIRSGTSAGIERESSTSKELGERRRSRSEQSVQSHTRRYPRARGEGLFPASVVVWFVVAVAVGGAVGIARAELILGECVAQLHEENECGNTIAQSDIPLSFAFRLNERFVVEQISEDLDIRNKGRNFLTSIPFSEEVWDHSFDNFSSGVLISSSPEEDSANLAKMCSLKNDCTKDVSLVGTIPYDAVRLKMYVEYYPLAAKVVEFAESLDEDTAGTYHSLYLVSLSARGNDATSSWFLSVRVSTTFTNGVVVDLKVSAQLTDRELVGGSSRPYNIVEFEPADVRAKFAKRFIDIANLLEVRISVAIDIQATSFEEENIAPGPQDVVSILCLETLFDTKGGNEVSMGGSSHAGELRLPFFPEDLRVAGLYRDETALSNLTWLAASVDGIATDSLEVRCVGFPDILLPSPTPNTFEITPLPTPSSQPLPSETAAPTATASPTAAPSPSATASPTATPSPSATPSPTATASPTASASASATPALVVTFPSLEPSATPSESPSATPNGVILKPTGPSTPPPTTVPSAPPTSLPTAEPSGVGAGAVGVGAGAAAGIAAGVVTVVTISIVVGVLLFVRRKEDGPDESSDSQFDEERQVPRDHALGSLPQEPIAVAASSAVHNAPEPDNEPTVPLFSDIPAVPDQRQSDRGLNEESNPGGSGIETPEVQAVVQPVLQPVVAPTEEFNRAGSSRTDAERALDQIVIPKSKVRMLQLIGSGGFASVYRGRYGGEDVAVKVLSKTANGFVGCTGATMATQMETPPGVDIIVTTSVNLTSADGGVPQDVLREIASLEKCRHPAVANFFGVCLGTDESDPIWLVMELASRGTLQDQLLRSSLSEFPWKDRLKVAYQVSLGMEYMHTSPRRIFHGDIKPANIILSENGTPKVIDFGIAAFYGESGESSGLRARRRGTLMYMAPELLNISSGEELREPEKADVYSFGMLCFVLAHQTEYGGALVPVETHEIGSGEGERQMKWSTGDTFSSMLDEASRGGTHEVVVDLACPTHNTMGSFLGEFHLNIETAGDVPTAPLLAQATNGGESVLGRDTTVQSPPSTSSGTRSGTGADAAWLRVYLSRVDSVLFRVSATACSSAQAYLEQVLAFRSEYGFQMRCAPACPRVLAHTVSLCTHPDPSCRPSFSELTQLLYDFSNEEIVNSA